MTLLDDHPAPTADCSTVDPDGPEPVPERLPRRASSQPSDAQVGRLVELDQAEAAVRGHDLFTIDDLLGLLHPSWHRHAACRGEGVDAWFPGPGSTTEDAKAVCGRCPVVETCREWAIGFPTALHGVWGGLSERERRALRTSAMADAAKAA